MHPLRLGTREEEQEHEDVEGDYHVRGEADTRPAAQALTENVLMRKRRFNTVEKRKNGERTSKERWMFWERGSRK